MGLYVGASVLVKTTGTHFTHYEDGANDFINASANSDTILSGAGRDTIFAGGGNDTIDGGKGNDYISATSSGWSGVSGHWGNDTAYGGQGDDVLDFSANRDSVHLYGDDMANAQTGNDRLYGGSGADWLDGGNGSDQIWGNDGNDTLAGGAGDDTLVGGRGQDVYWGEAGRDTIVINSGDSALDWAHADITRNFNSAEDRMDLKYAGTATNLGITVDHHYLNGDNPTNYGNAELLAQVNMSLHPEQKYEFVTNGTDGWLFVNDDGRAGIDYGVEMKNTNHFDWHNIV